MVGLDSMVIDGLGAGAELGAVDAHGEGEGEEPPQASTTSSAAIVVAMSELGGRLVM